MAGDMAAIALVGRLDRVPRARVAREVERRGRRLVGRFGGSCGELVLGHGAATLIASGRLALILARARELNLAVSSEDAFLRRLGLLAPPAPAARPLYAPELGRRAGLDEGTVALLRLFDLLEADDEGRFSFSDLVAARALAAVLRDAAPLGAVIETAVAVRRHAPLSRSRLVKTPSGEVALAVGRHLAETSGQLRLDLGEGANPSPDAIFAAAEEATEAADDATAERLWRRLMLAAPQDAAPRFNLANLLCRTGRRREARLLFNEALALDPGLAEAPYNLAHLDEEEGDAEGARRHLAEALAIDPDYADAVWNLARLELDAGGTARAAALYERYLALDPHSDWARRARKALAYCRMARLT